MPMTYLYIYIYIYSFPVSLGAGDVVARMGLLCCGERGVVGLMIGYAGIQLYIDRWMDGCRQEMRCGNGGCE